MKVSFWQRLATRRLRCRLGLSIQRRSSKGNVLFLSAMLMAYISSLVAAQAVTEPVRGPGESLVFEAARRALDARSMSAQIQHRMDLYGRDLVGSGMYHQARLDRDLLFRTELQVPLIEGIMNLLQIGDGRFVWTRISRPALKGEPQILPRETRQDAISVEDYLGLSDPQTAIAAEQEMQGIAPLGIGGLLCQLGRRFEFGPPQASELKGAPIWLVKGSRKPSLETRTQLVPQSVTMAFGKEDLFPYVIEYRQLVSEKKKKKKQEIVIQGSERIIMAIEFFQVDLNAPYNPQIFVFRPLSQSARHP